MDNASQPKINCYQDAMRWLYDRIDYERVRPGGQSNPFRLERIQSLLRLIGSPQERIPVVHLAGTKGKGSTAAFTESILRAAGYRTGLYTSPHIEVFEERMQVNRTLPTQEQMTTLIREVAETLYLHDDHGGSRLPTFFEIATLLAWRFFDQQNVDIVVLETGLGGRLDCTNVCRPLVTVITTIGLDHTQILGNTLELIAAEKAGILKQGIPVIQGRLPSSADQVVGNRSEDLGCQRLCLGVDFLAMNRRVDDLPQPGIAQVFDLKIHALDVAEPLILGELGIPLRGQHQIDNAALAVMVTQALKNQWDFRITDSDVLKGLSETQWPLRFEVISGTPVTVLDAAHNPDSISALVRTLDEDSWNNRPRVIVFGSSSDKDSETMLSLLCGRCDQLVLTRYTTNPRSMAPDRLAETFARVSQTSVSKSSPTCVHVCEVPADALKLAAELAGLNGLVCVTGSLFLAAEARTLLLPFR
ncbi:MAG: bifunctional folylpolyglutamate synthase/dihydrofolate synthase [Planctomyces sp.]|nr:bifunctional folylpolyglutamate synthase/dihydrofolate synthase [Planctomyces sp.]